MPDVRVVKHLLAANSALTAVVPAARIAAGSLPQGTQMPAISVMHVGSQSLSEISKQSQDRTARVQVTIHAKNYPQQKQVLKLVCEAVPRTRGLIAGVNVVSIRRVGDGPDFSDDAAGIFEQVQDFFVAYSE